MTDRPGAHTSNYGWALWHLQEGDGGTHPQHAIARALLAVVEALGPLAGTSPSGPSTWEGYTDD